MNKRLNSNKIDIRRFLYYSSGLRRSLYNLNINYEVCVKYIDNQSLIFSFVTLLVGKTQKSDKLNKYIYNLDI